jgi:hypothetical protein
VCLIGPVIAKPHVPWKEKLMLVGTAPVNQLLLVLGDDQFVEVRCDPIRAHGGFNPNTQ